MTFQNSHDDNKSKLHKNVRKLLKELFPKWIIKEEESISIDEHTLFCDFYIKSPFGTIIIEVDGIQHKEFVKHFHKNDFAFRNAQELDLLKEKYADMNDCAFVRISGEIEKDKLRSMIMNAVSKL